MLLIRMHLCVCICTMSSVHVCILGMWVCACERARVFCQPRGCFLSLARRRSHHWTDGQHPPSLLPSPFIYSSIAPSITVFFSRIPPNTTSPQPLIPHLPASLHPSFPSYLSHNKSEWCSVFTFPHRYSLLHPYWVL